MEIFFFRPLSPYRVHKYLLSILFHILHSRVLVNKKIQPFLLCVYPLKIICSVCAQAEDKERIFWVSSHRQNCIYARTSAIRCYS